MWECVGKHRNKPQITADTDAPALRRSKENAADIQDWNKEHDIDAYEVGKLMDQGHSLGYAFFSVAGPDILAAVGSTTSAESSPPEKQQLNGLVEEQAAESTPKPGSLTDIQTRDWYNNKVAEIDKVEQQMRADGKSAKEIFETTTQLRNDAKMQARDLMQDQDLAKSLPPPKSAEEILKKYGGDYEKAIAASKRTNPTVNKAIEDRRASGEQ